MPGKHRKTSRPAAIVAMVVAPAGLAAATMALTSVPAPVPPDTTVAAPSVGLRALVSTANSTSQFFAGSSYYGTDWTDVYGTQQVVPFLAGPQGIADAISSHQNDPAKTGVTASGWGAGQTGTALGILASNSDPHDLKNVGLVILDNNTNRAGGGFWTTYYPFAPLLLTTADPTPTNLPANVKVLDVAYEYNINSDAPVDPLNPFALGNSLAAYAYGYGQESTALDITQAPAGGPVTLHQANGTPMVLQPGTHYIVKDGNVVQTYPATGTAANPNNSTIYVTVATDELPLTRPLRLIPGGDILANAIDPTLTELVDAGYNDGKGTASDPAIPQDPTVTRPMKPGSSLSALGGVPATVQDGAAAGAETAIKDVTDPTNLITKPIDEFKKLPGLSSLGGSTTGVTPFLTGNKVTPNAAKSGTSSSAGNANPLKKIGDDFNSSLKKFADAVNPKKPAAGDDEG